MAKGMSLRGALAKDMGKAAPVKVASAKPDPYAAMPADVAAAMRQSDKSGVLAKGKAALSKGTVTGKGDIQRSTRTQGARGGAGYIGIGGKKG